MKLVRLPYTKRATKEYNVAFGGVNMTENFSDGEIADCTNMSSDKFPCLSQRNKRTYLVTDWKLSSSLGTFTTEDLYVKNGLVFVTHGDTMGTYMIWYQCVKDGIKKQFIIGTLSSEPKAIAMLEKYIVCFPSGDVLYFDEDAESITQESFKIENRVVLTGETKFGDIVSNTTTGKYIAKTTDFRYGFNIGDTVVISGSTIPKLNDKAGATIRDMTTIIVENVIYYALVFDEDIFTSMIEVNDITIKRECPPLEFACSWNNRIWGTYKNDIYASALGNPFVFYRYDGVATDSYAVSCGSPGEFTGIYPYGTHLCFFKENIIHRIYGTLPENYTLSSLLAPGVQTGSAKSLVNINETLYYKGNNGFYAYNGNLPELISSNITGNWSKAVSGSDGKKYYSSVKNTDGNYRLFTYDPLRGLWHIEDNIQVRAFAFYDNTLFFIDEARRQSVINDTGYSAEYCAIWGGDVCVYLDEEPTETITWNVTFCKMNEINLERKTYSQLLLRVSMSLGAWFEVGVSYDGIVWEHAATVSYDDRKPTVVVPIELRKCDRLQIKIKGSGDCVIRSLVRKYTLGGLK